ncbi:hypothetical protein L1049_009570 [Liquidambar formosana]|uniref:Programmed cell death protein 5 n=1 Tax=Liquidambar formosana TaxID=63359 RepID=A0AAP0R3I3_LIQFO
MLVATMAMRRRRFRPMVKPILLPSLVDLSDNSVSRPVKVPASCWTDLSAADPELEAIRQRRMQELMANHGVGNNQSSEQQSAQEDAKREADERRQMMLSQILSSEARERIARIALVKPDKARGVEDVLLRAAQMGQIVEKVSEERLISLLEQINNQTTKQTKVTIQRRRSVLDDDD